MTKFFKKSKKTYAGAILGPFLPKFGQKWLFLEKRALSVFKYSDYVPSCKESEKSNNPILRKMPNWWTDRQITTDK